MSRSRSLRTSSLAVSLALVALQVVLAAPASAASNALALGVPSSPRNVLVVFIPGTQLSAAESTKFLQEAVKQGYHAIGVNYPNSKSVGRYCGDKDSCYEQVRRELVYGNAGTYDSDDYFDSGKVDISPANSIVGQLTQKLVELKSNASWAQFLSNTDRVLWNKVVVTGHSQGAGHAAILGIDQVVARVGLMAGPNDDVSGGNGVPPSWTNLAPATSESLWYGLAHDKDKSKGKQLKSWDNLFGFASDMAIGQVPTGKHRLITTLSAPDDRYHESVVVDQYLNLTNSAPTLAPTWDSLIGTGASTPTTVATPTISPNGGTFATSQSVTLSTTTADAQIRYTTDGSDPTEASALYTGPFSVSETTTVKARSFKSGLTASGIASATFTKSTSGGTGAIQFQTSSTATGIATSSISVDRPEGTVTGDLLLAAVRQKKTTGNVTANSWNLIRQDGNGARTALLWRIAGSEAGPYAFSLSTTADVEAHVLRFSGVNASAPVAASGVGTDSGTAVGTTIDAPSLEVPGGGLYVAVWTAKSTGLSVTPADGTTEHTDTSLSTTLATGSEGRGVPGPTGVRTAQVSSSAEKRIGQAVALAPGSATNTVATPTINPNGGTFATSQSVTLSTTTADAQIRYTTDGSDPTEASALYTGPFSVSETTTVKARAFKSGQTASGIASATFTKTTGGGTGSVQFQTAATATGTAVSSISVGKPAGTVAGDLLLAAVRQKKTTGNVTGSGWNPIRQDGTSARTSLLWRIAGSEAGPYAFSLGTTADAEAHILRFSGVNATTPVAASGVGTDSGTTVGTTIDAPSLEAVTGSLYVAVWSARYMSMAVDPPPGTTEHTDTSGITTLSTASEARGAGPTGVRTATLAGSASSDRRIGQAVVLRPA